MREVADLEGLTGNHEPFNMLRSPARSKQGKFGGFHVQTEDKPSNRQLSVQIWRLAAYFSGLLLFSYVTRLLFSQFNLDSLAGFKKFTDLINETANVTAKRDDVIVTAYSLGLTLLGVLPIGWVYTFTKEEEGYDPSLVQTLFVLGLTVCGVMMMLQDSLARAFGFLGVVGAVRYRNTLKDPKDAVYVFVALGIGMGCGLRVYHIAGLLSLVLCVVFLVMWKLGTGQSGQINLRAEAAKEKPGKIKKHTEKRAFEALLSQLSDETRHAVKKELNKKRAEAAEERLQAKPPGSL